MPVVVGARHYWPPGRIEGGRYAPALLMPRPAARAALDGLITRRMAALMAFGLCCGSRCPAAGRCTRAAPGMPAARSQESAGGVKGSAPPLTMIVFARIDPRVWYWS